MRLGSVGETGGRRGVGKVRLSPDLLPLPASGAGAWGVAGRQGVCGGRGVRASPVFPRLACCWEATRSRGGRSEAQVCEGRVWAERGVGLERGGEARCVCALGGLFCVCPEGVCWGECGERGVGGMCVFGESEVVFVCVCRWESG